MLGGRKLGLAERFRIREAMGWTGKCERGPTLSSSAGRGDFAGGSAALHADLLTGRAWLE